MDAAHLENNPREYEITKNVSLVSLDRVAFTQLKMAGQCTFNIPESAYDLDHPGHYMRRIKSVSLTIPCVAGPYSAINCTLTLLSSSVRIAAERTANTIRDDFCAAQTIVTSARKDTGLFDTNLRDERYRPFEGRGAINSTWQIKLPSSDNSFDMASVSDVILHIRYTSQPSGTTLET
jgi:hypothetical protein